MQVAPNSEQDGRFSAKAQRAVAGRELGKKPFGEQGHLAGRLARAREDAHYPRMSLRHSTKPAALLRFAGAACAAALFASAPAYAADLRLPSAQVRIDPGTASASQMPRQISVYGRAPARCAPTVAGVSLDGADLDIELKVPQTGCNERRSVPFNLRIDPVASAGMPILPGQVYRARIYAQDRGSSPLIAFQLLDTTAPGAAAVPENGFWWSQTGKDSGPASPGTGANIEWQDGQLAVGLFGFADSGAPTWSFGSTPLHGRIATVSLVQLADGDPPFAPTGSQPSAEYGPRLEIEFLTPTSARAWLVRHEAGRDLEVRALNLARSRFASGPVGTAWSGQWVLVADDNGAPRLFEFAEPSSQDAETFHLADPGNDARLDCRLAAGSQQPGLCTLSAAAVTLADFDQVGLDRLSGRSNDGARVKLIRVAR